MEIKVPTELIRELQTLLRNDAALSSYDPDDPTVPTLPSVCDSIAQFDPSPANLRCDRCRGRLLKVSHSVVHCVYCGQEQRNEVPPGPIAFKSTVGCRWLLQFLHLDGSETVEPSTEGNSFGSRRSVNVSKDESLFDLLDLEIKWPTELNEHVNTVSSVESLQGKSSLNLKGVDLDNFLYGSKRYNVSGTSVPDKEKVDDDSGWGVDIQSASSTASHEEPKFFDPSLGSSNVISDHMDAFFGSGTVKNCHNNKGDLPPRSITNDWFQKDICDNPISSASNQADLSKSTTEIKDVGSSGNLNSCSSSVDWTRDNQWKTRKSDVAECMESNEENANIRLFAPANNLGEMGFNCFSQPDLFSDAFSNQNSSMEVHDIQSKFSVSNSISATKVEDQGNPEHDGQVLDVFRVTKESNSDDADIMASHMQDLSFMLENSLSIPP